MKSNFLLLALCMAIICSCSQKEQQRFTSHKTAKWSDAQSSACDAMSINGLLGLNGKDVYYLPKCLSGVDENGELKNFQATNQLMESLGVDAISQTMDLVKVNPESEEGLPLMSSLLVFLERGTVVQGKSNKALEDKMFGPFQEFLLEMDPYWASHLAIGMATSGHMEKVLDDVAPLVETIDMEPVFGNINATLTDSDMRESLVYAGTRVLDTAALYDSFRNILTFENSRSVISGQQNVYLSDWLDPQVNDFAQEPIEDKYLEETPKNGFDRYQSFLANLSDDEIAKIAKISSVLFQEFATMESEERLSVIKKLFDGASEAYTEQAAPVRNIMALLDYLTNNAKTIDLQYVIKGISELLEVTGPAAILSLNHKMGSSKLHTLADKVLYEGGAVAGCDLQMVGISQLDIDDYDDILEAITTFISPNTSCQFGLSPLASLVYSEINQKVGVEFDCRGGLCFSSEEMERVATTLKSFNWSDLSDQRNTDPAMIKEFLVDILTETKEQLEEDSYALYWDHYSIGSVDSSVIAKIVKLIEAKSGVSASDIVELDQQIETSEEFRRYFHPQFLENLLAAKIASLSAVAEQFSDLFDARNENKAERIFSGAYLQGPLYQIVSSALSAPELQGDLQVPRIQFRVAELVSRLKKPGNIFKNSRLDWYEEEIPLKFLGDRSRSVEFVFDRVTDQQTGDKVYVYQGIDFSKSPTELNDIFSDDFFRFNKLLVNDQLLGKDIAEGRSDEFTLWAQNELYPHLMEGINWKSQIRSFSRQKTINTKYFDVDSYSAEEMRRIALFYSKNFMAAPTSLPEDESTYRMERRRTKRTPNVSTQFLELPNGRLSKWRSFNNSFPASLSVNQSLTDYLQTITKEQFDAIDWSNMPFDKSGKYDLEGYSEDETELIQTLSALNLLTVNRSKQYMPFVALDQYCSYRDKPEDCPITFIDSGEKMAIQSLREYITKMAQAYTCSVISTEDSSFNSLMKETLSLDDFDSSVCSDSNNAFSLYDNGVPEWLHRHIIKDLYLMGKKATLKPGLSTIVGKIRYQRLAKKYPKDLFQVMRGLTNSSSFIPGDMNAYAEKQMADHKGFLVYRPGFLNIYINYLIKRISYGGYSEELLAYYGAGVKAGEDLSGGVGQTLLTDLLIGTFNQISDKNVSVLDYLFRVIQKMARPEQRKHLDAISNILAYPQDLETLSTYTMTVPLLIKHLSSYDLPQSFWERPGNSIVRYILLQQEKLRSLNDLFLNFDQDDLSSALETIVDTFYILGSSDEINVLVKKVVSYLRDSLISCNDDGEGIIRILETNLRNIMLEDAVDQDFRSVNNLIHLMGQQTVDFKGKTVAPIVDQIETIFSFGVKKLANLLWHYQEFVGAHEQEEGYLHKMVHSFIDPLQGTLGDLGAKAVSTMLSSTDLASWDSLIRPLLFDKKYQKMLIEVVSASDKASVDEYQAALEETNVLLPQANVYLNYVVEHAKWNSESSQYAMESLMRLSGQSSYILNKQVNVMNNWLSKAKKNKLR